MKLGSSHLAKLFKSELTVSGVEGACQYVHKSLTSKIIEAYQSVPKPSLSKPL